MFSLCPHAFYASGEPAFAPRKLEAGNLPLRGAKTRDHAFCPLHPKTSYGHNDANEMAAIKTILIIVNS